MLNRSQHRGVNIAGYVGVIAWLVLLSLFGRFAMQPDEVRVKQQQAQETMQKSFNDYVNGQNQQEDWTLGVFFKLK